MANMVNKACRCPCRQGWHEMHRLHCLCRWTMVRAEQQCCGTAREVEPITHAGQRQGHSASHAVMQVAASGGIAIRLRMMGEESVLFSCTILLLHSQPHCVCHMTCPSAPAPLLCKMLKCDSKRYTLKLGAGLLVSGRLLCHCLHQCNLCVRPQLASGCFACATSASA